MAKQITTAANVLTWACAGNPTWWDFVVRVSKHDLAATVKCGSEVRAFPDGSALVVRSVWRDDAGKITGIRCAVAA